MNSITIPYSYKRYSSKRKVVTTLLCIFMFIGMFIAKIEATSRIPVFYYQKWTVYLDSPDTAKPYYHLHFYNGKVHVYCLRLDNLQPCDGTGPNKEKVPKKVREEVMKVNKVKNTVTNYKPIIKSASIRNIVKPLVLVGAAMLVIVSAANVFTGPIDDVAAWSILVSVAGW